MGTVVTVRAHSRLPGQPSLVESFWDRVRKTRGCWFWTDTPNSWGYGTFTFEDVHYVAARLAYELTVGPIPGGHRLYHRCRRRACVRPDHMEPVTIRGLSMRGYTLVRARAAAKTCIHGHAFTPRNTYRKPNGCRSCRTCSQLRKRGPLPYTSPGAWLRSVFPKSCVVKGLV